VKFDVKEDYYLFRILRLLFIAVLFIKSQHSISSNLNFLCNPFQTEQYMIFCIFFNFLFVYFLLSRA